MIKPLYCCDEYQVDSEGYILSKRGKRMHPSTNHGGYYITTLMINGKRFSLPIHLAVARTFLGDRTYEGLVVNHKDGNKKNNCVDNLEWVTNSENSRHAVNVLGAGLGANNGNAKAICGYDKKTSELKYSFGSIMDAARFIAPMTKNKNIKRTQNCIWRVLAGIRKSYMGYIWKYSE